VTAGGVAHKTLQLVHGQNHRLAGGGFFQLAARRGVLAGSGRTWTRVLIFSRKIFSQRAVSRASIWLVGSWVAIGHRVYPIQIFQPSSRCSETRTSGSRGTKRFGTESGGSGSPLIPRPA
jgi:hypothetical protein